MLYVISRKDGAGQVFLVKAETDTELKERLQIKEDERIIASFTLSELESLQSSQFAVVSFGHCGG